MDTIDLIKWVDKAHKMHLKSLEKEGDGFEESPEGCLRLTQPDNIHGLDFDLAVLIIRTSTQIHLPRWIKQTT